MKKMLVMLFVAIFSYMGAKAETEYKIYEVSGNYSELGLKDGENVEVKIDNERNIIFLHPYMVVDMAYRDQNVTAGYIFDGWAEHRYYINDTKNKVLIQFNSGNMRMDRLPSTIRVNKSCTLREKR